MRTIPASLAPALALALAAAVLVLGGCGDSASTGASVQANQEEQKLLQEQIQKGIARSPLTKPARPKRR